MFCADTAHVEQGVKQARCCSQLLFHLVLLFGEVIGNKNVTHFSLKTTDIFHPSLMTEVTFQCKLVGGKQLYWMLWY